MKDPLHLFRSRRISHTSVIDPPPFSRSSGLSRATVAISLALLIGSFAGLAAGLHWLKNGEPKDDRPWQPHEALMVAPPADEFPDSVADSDADALVALPESSSSSSSVPPPAIAEAPPERMDDKPSAPVQVGKATSARKPSTPRPAKSRRKEASASSKPVSQTRRRTPEPTTRTPVNRSAPDVLDKDLSEFARPYRDTAGQQVPIRGASFYDDREDPYFDQGPVERRYVETDQRNVYRRRSRQTYPPLEPPHLVEFSPSDVIVRFRIRYAVHENREAVIRRTENRIRLRRLGPGRRVITIQERQMDDDY